ncbi:MAG: TIGR01244 family phosphatase [Betaproteobacteria bacterium]|jgi:uncharacterized protein (TIGR01244 family)|nr:TIGR01244 family phosphatase [Betaproteobacteria bacterium]NBS46699.1 TIGR01244 family phosphatase [Betaproteobacteria bacterium]
MNPRVQYLSDQFAVAAQLGAADVPGVAAQGFRTLVNNRPDGEAMGQPVHADIEAAARAAGLHYVFLPVIPGAITPDEARAMKQVLTTAPGPVLAFCRSGSRSANLYSLALQA